jgi:hypothetical protein
VFQFPPPVEMPAGYLRFSWWAAAGVTGLLLVIAISWWRGRLRGPGRGVTEKPIPQPATRKLAGWGGLAIGWTLGWWLLAWTRFAWFAPLQSYTFFPLWLGFIVGVNALTLHRTGSCLMLRAPGKWVTLFLVSALFWWGFEWLNRFVHNWHYLAEGFGPAGYAVHATVCFSTVLPAVAAVAEWLGSYSRWLNWAAAGPAWPWFARRGTAVVLAAGGLLALAGTGMYPRWTYPALWVAPLALLLAARVFQDRGGLAGEIGRGDWSRAATWMLAALICGFFWELWNWRSVAKWIYTVPGVERWFVFEMPLLGFAGYLPFGLECLLVVERVARGDAVFGRRGRGEPAGRAVRWQGRRSPPCRDRAAS